MEKHSYTFAVGDRVQALRRPEFPSAFVVQLLDGGFVLVRWQGDLLETAHQSEIDRAD